MTPAFPHPRTATSRSQELAERLRVSGYPITEPMRLGRFLSPEPITAQNDNHAVSGRRGQSTGFFSQCIDNQGEAYDLNQSSFGAIGTESDLPIRRAEPRQLPTNKREEYKSQQSAYTAKIRTALTPRPLSDALKEIDSTKDNPPNSKSARFGIKPETDMYQYRLVSWGEAGSGIPLVNNPYSVRQQNAPAVDTQFKRKKFTALQRDTVRNAPYRQAVQNILKTGLHNSHGLASRFLGPETSANIAPSTFTNHKNKSWGQGEMQSHLEHALFRIEAKTSNQGISVFLRCTDYLGKFGELQSRKIKVFLSEVVTDRKIRAEKGNVKEITLGTFYFPGMVNESETSDFIKAFRSEVIRLEDAVDLLLDCNAEHDKPYPPLEIRYKNGVCAQDLKELSYKKLVHGKHCRTNDGLRPVLQRNPKSPETVAEPTNAMKTSTVFSNPQQEKQQKVFHQIQKIKENPRVLKAGEELWEMDDIETALGHIRRPDLEDHIKALVNSGELIWSQNPIDSSQGLSHSSSEDSLSSLSTVNSEIAHGGIKIFEVEFESDQTQSTSNSHQTADSTFDPSSNASQTPAWLQKSSERKRKPQFY